MLLFLEGIGWGPVVLGTRYPVSPVGMSVQLKKPHFDENMF